MPSFEVRNPDYADRVRAIFDEARFIQLLGIELSDCGPGYAESSLAVRPDLLQQNELIHAGVQATMADHTAGAAAGTLMAADQIVLSVEYKVQLLRAAKGSELRCRGEVIKAGSRFAAVEASVYCQAEEREVLTAKLTATMAYISNAD